MMERIQLVSVLDRQGENLMFQWGLKLATGAQTNLKPALYGRVDW